MYSKSNKVPRQCLLFFRLFSSVHPSKHSGKICPCPDEIKSGNLRSSIKVTETFIKCGDCPFFFSLDLAERNPKVKRRNYSDFAVAGFLVALGNVSEGGDCFRDPSW